MEQRWCACGYARSQCLIITLPLKENAYFLFLSFFAATNLSSRRISHLNKFQKSFIHWLFPRIVQQMGSQFVIVSIIIIDIIVIVARDTCAHRCVSMRDMNVPIWHTELIYGHHHQHRIELLLLLLLSKWLCVPQWQDFWYRLGVGCVAWRACIIRCGEKFITVNFNEN